MDSLREKANSADTTVSKHATEIIRFNQPTWKYQEQNLEMERYFLQWTEQKRMAIDPGYPSPVKVDHDQGYAIEDSLNILCFRSSEEATKSMLSPKCTRDLETETRRAMSEAQDTGYCTQALTSRDGLPSSHK